MRRVDYLTVTLLESRAPGASESDFILIYQQINASQIFGALDEDFRDRIKAKMQYMDGLIPTLRTFFENFKYFRACADCVKALVEVSPRSTLCQTMERAFDGGRHLVSESRSTSQVHRADDRGGFTIRYQEVFLYVMHHI